MRLISLLLLLSLDLEASRALSGLNKKEFYGIKGMIDWENNPFMQSTDNISVDDMVLFAIVHRKDHAAALINDQIVQVGDKLGTSELVAIDKQTVTLRNENGIFKLSFRRAKK